jgi:hypothetical protein
LGNSPTPGTVSIEVTASSDALWACINGGSNHPKAANKENVQADVAGTGDFPIGKNGSASGTVRVEAPGPGTFSCPSGQNLVLVSVTYSNILISDLTNAFNAGVQEVPVPPGSVSETFFDLD